MHDQRDMTGRDCPHHAYVTQRFDAVSTGAAGVAERRAGGGAAPCMPFAGTIGTLARVGGFE